MDKLVDKYYPRLREQFKSEPAHMKSEPVDWLAHVQTAAETEEDTVTIASNNEDEDTRPSTPTNVDDTFKSKLIDLTFTMIYHLTDFKQLRYEIIVIKQQHSFNYLLIRNLSHYMLLTGHR